MTSFGRQFDFHDVIYPIHIVTLTIDGVTFLQLHVHTGQCKRTGGCYNELVVAFFSTGGGVKGNKSIPVDFIIYL